MIWSNEGHQFDKTGKLFEDKAIMIYGANSEGAGFYNKVKFLQQPTMFIDRNEELQSCGMHGNRVISVNELAHMEKKTHIVIVCVQGYNGNLVLKQLLHLGYELGVNCFYSNIFLDYYLPIYALYEQDIVYFPSISFLVTTKCNLTCKGCLNFTNQNASKRHYSIGELKQNADYFFSAVDYVEKFHMSGGEPFLYPDFVRILSYVYENYGQRIGAVYTATNGTILPSDDICSALSTCNVFVEVDDYRSALSKPLLKNDSVIAKLKDYGICHSDRGADYWIDLLPHNYSNGCQNDNDLSIWYDTCNNPFASVHNGKLYSCNYDDYAKEAGIAAPNPDDYLDLSMSHSKRELVEFRQGYTKRGYVEFCKQCAGHEMTNRSHIAVAQQASAAQQLRPLKKE